MQNIHPVNHSVSAAAITPASADLATALALVEILHDFNADSPITVAQVNASAHVTDQQILEVGFNALLNPNMTAGQVIDEIVLATIQPAPTQFEAQLITAPTLADDALAIQLIGQHQVVFGY